MKKFTTLGTALLLAGLASTASASIITTGHFDIGGTIFVTSANPTATVTTPAGICPIATACIFFQDPTGTNNGRVDISNNNLPNGDIPLLLAGNLNGIISSLLNPPDIVGSFPATPFLSFAGGTGVTTVLNITSIDPGIDPPGGCFTTPANARTGDTCTIPGSPFNFVNNGPPFPAGTLCNGGCQGAATFVFEGQTSNTNSGSSQVSNWVGNFSATFPVGKTYEQLLADLATNGFVSNTFAGTITLTPPSTVPEPGSIMMIGGGLIGLAMFMRKRASR